MAGGVTVLVDAGRIAGVEPGHPEIGADWQVLDYPGATIMPGLADAHERRVEVTRAEPRPMPIPEAV